MQMSPIKTFVRLPLLAT